MPDWRSWKLADWNAALVRTVFFDESRLSLPLTRIQAGGRFLAACAGDPAADPAAVQRAFIASFVSSTHRIRTHFAQCVPLADETAHLGYPAAFADLYITLLAAGADHSTYGEGNFRKRFAELLYPLQISAPDFSGLPSLWRHVAGWSAGRAAQGTGCRVLVLPPPGSETLIGYSKRLAFPAYADEIRLERTLQTAGIDFRAEFSAVARAVSHSRSSFSPVFQEEFDAFSRLAAAQKLRESYESPFWGAVQSITWHQERSESVRNGMFRLLADAGDPACPELHLLADDTGRAALASYAARPSAGGVGTHAVLAHSTGGWTPERLLAAGQGRLAAGRLWALLGRGCLALFPDRHGILAADGEHSDGAAACIAIKGEAGRQLDALARSLNIRCTVSQPPGVSNSWRIIVFGGVRSASLARLADSLPREMRGAFSTQWVPRHPSFAGGAWFGQTLLLNPASTPSVRWQDAESGSFEICGPDGTPVSIGSLEELEDGFRIPPQALAAATGGGKARFTLSGPSGSAEASAPFAESFPLMPPLPFSDPAAWLHDGRSGRLEPVLGQLSAPSGMAGGALPLLIRQPLSEITSIGGDSSLELFCGWIGEALALRFQTRATLPFGELKTHISSACAGAGLAEWRARRLLFAAGWIETVQRRSSPYSCVAASPRSISVGAADAGGRSSVRISGMFSFSEVLAIRECLGQGCGLRRIGTEEHGFGIGVLSATIANPAAADTAAARFGLARINAANSGPLEPACDAPWNVSGAVLPEGLFEKWDSAAQAWAPPAAVHGQPEHGALLRARGSQRDAFWIASRSGYWKTDSLAWARLMQTAAAGLPACIVSSSGSAQFSARLASLPPVLVQWWLHWGGGYIGVTPSGAIYFGGEANAGLWQPLERWFARETAVQHQSQHALADARRRLAMRIRRTRNTAQINKE